MTALQRANELIYGQRAADYGDPVENFDRLAALWSVVLGVEVTAQQVCLCLTQLKISRLIHQPGHQDSVDDAAGYIGCYDRVLNERPPRAEGLTIQYNGEPITLPGPVLTKSHVTTYLCLKDGCGAGFRTQQDLDTHIDTIHATCVGCHTVDNCPPDCSGAACHMHPFCHRSPLKEQVVAALDGTLQVEPLTPPE